MQPTDTALVLGVALVALAALVLGPGLMLKLRARRRGVEPPPFVGPLFRAEALRLSRHGTQLRLRVAFTLFLLVGLLVAYLRQFPAVGPLAIVFGTDQAFPLDESAKLAEAFFATYVLLQLAVLTLVTPVFAAGAVFEERDGRTLDLLRSSMLSDREIVVGKLTARVAFVLSLTLAGLPVLALTMLFGGVDGGLVVAAFVVFVFWTVALAAYSFLVATRSESLRESLWQVYFGTLLTPVFLTPVLASSRWLAGASPFAWWAGKFAAFGNGLSGPAATLVFVSIYGGVALFSGGRAIGRLKSLGTPRPTVVKAAGDGRLFPVPRVSDADPLLWKEANFSLQARWHPSFTAGCLTILVVVAVPLVLAGVLNHFIWHDRVNEPLSYLFRCLSVALVGLAVPFVGLVLVGSVSRERQQQTLDSLFTLPGDRADVLRAKWRSAYDFLLPARLTALVSVATAALSLTVHPLAAVVVGAVFAGAGAFFLSLGLWLSVRCRTVVRASVWFIGVALGLFGLPVLASVPAARVADSFGVFVAGFSPAFAAGYVPVRLEAGGGPDWRACCVAALASALALGGAALLLWRDACRTFDREGRS